LISLSLAAAIISGQTGWADAPKTRKSPVPGESQAQPSNGLSYRIYSLSDIGNQPGLGSWLGRVLPSVIQPDTWSMSGGSGTLSYYAPGKILVVYHTAAVQAQVAAFLKDVKKALPPKTAASAAVLPSGAPSPYQYGTSVNAELVKSSFQPSGATPILSSYSLPNGQTVGAASAPTKRAVAPSLVPAPSVKVPETAPAQTFSYPIPAAKQPPKHLFHFIIRYEGEGVIDSSVVGLFKAVYGDDVAKKEVPPAGSAPTPPGLSSTPGNPPISGPTPVVPPATTPSPGTKPAPATSDQ
jgi:hypothetical protein